MRTAGLTKHNPPTSNPSQPACRRPMWMAISVELGPGMRLVAPTRSRNSCSPSHLRRWTTSWCIKAMCAAGPPKAVKPSLRNRLATPRSLPERDSSMMGFCMRARPHVISDGEFAGCVHDHRTVAGTQNACAEGGLLAHGLLCQGRVPGEDGTRPMDTLLVRDHRIAAEQNPRR